MLDRLIGEFDRALRAVAGVHRAVRPSPSQGIQESDLEEQERVHAARSSAIRLPGSRAVSACPW